MSCFSAGVGRAGTFCVIYSAIRELNGTGNIGKDRTMLNNSYLLPVVTVLTIVIFIRASVNFLSLRVLNYVTLCYLFG